MGLGVHKAQLKWKETFLFAQLRRNSAMRVDAIADAVRQEMEWNKSRHFDSWRTLSTEHTHRIQHSIMGMWKMKSRASLRDELSADNRRNCLFSLLKCNLSSTCRKRACMIVLFLDSCGAKRMQKPNWDQVNGHRCPKMKLTNGLHGRRLCAQFCFVEPSSGRPRIG